MTLGVDESGYIDNSPSAKSHGKPSLLIDASIYIFRYYFSLPDRWFSRDEDYPTAAVYGYTKFLLGCLSAQQPQMMAACFDESLGSCFRNEIYPDYKASRVLPDEALAFQLQACREVSELLGIACFASDVYEADDLLGSLLHWLHGQLGDEQPIAILTRDKDLGQLLLREQDFLWDYLPGKLDNRSYRADLFEKFGVWPEQMADYLALVGDTVDDIPGVPGVGAKTATALLQHFDDFAGLYARLEELPVLKLRGAKTLGSKLQEHYEQALVSRSLAQIVTDIELDLSADALQLRQPDGDGLLSFIERMGLGRALHKQAEQYLLSV